MNFGGIPNSMQIHDCNQSNFKFHGRREIIEISLLNAIALYNYTQPNTKSAFLSEVCFLCHELHYNYLSFDLKQA